MGKRKAFSDPKYLDQKSCGVPLVLFTRALWGFVTSASLVLQHIAICDVMA